MHHQELIDAYLSGPELVQQAVQGMSEEQLNAKPVAGKMVNAAGRMSSG